MIIWNNIVKEKNIWFAIIMIIVVVNIKREYQKVVLKWYHFLFKTNTLTNTWILHFIVINFSSYRFLIDMICIIIQLILDVSNSISYFLHNYQKQMDYELHK